VGAGLIRVPVFPVRRLSETLHWSPISGPLLWHSALPLGAQIVATPRWGSRHPRGARQSGFRVTPTAPFYRKVFAAPGFEGFLPCRRALREEVLNLAKGSNVV